MKKLLSFAALALLSSGATTLAGWSTVCSAGATIDESSQNIFRTTSAGLSLRDGASGLVAARYNVTFPSETNPSPAWTTFELGYTDYSTNTSVQAILYQVDPCTGFGTKIARIDSTDQSTAGTPDPNVNPPRGCLTVAIPSGSFDFTNKLYYVYLVVARTGDPASRVAARTIRIY